MGGAIRCPRIQEGGFTALPWRTSSGTFWRALGRATEEAAREAVGEVVIGDPERHLLEDGLPPAAALREAQLAILAEERWRAPYFWAPFSRSGD